MPASPLRLGDLAVIGDYPAKALKALAVIADKLHPAYDALDGGARAGRSRELCLFNSLAVRAFLVEIGFTDADVKPCAVLMRAELDDRPVHTLGVGLPDQPDIPGKFNSHAIVAVPSIALMIDATLYQAQRPQWRGALPGMIALPYAPNGLTIAGRRVTSRAEPGFVFDISWTARPEIDIRRQRDFRDAASIARRRRVAAAMRERFGRWREE
jgi:hypothetical protein